MPKPLIYLTLKASKILYGWFITSHLLPWSVIAYFSWSIALVLLPVFLYLFFSGIESLKPNSNRWVSTIHLQESGDWFLTRPGQKPVRAFLYRWTVFQSYWIQLTFLDQKGREFIVYIFSDSTDAESRRQLRLWLRCCG